MVTEIIFFVIIAVIIEIFDVHWKVIFKIDLYADEKVP